MEYHALKLNKVPLFAKNNNKYHKVPRFARKPGNINVLRSAAPKVALVPGNRYDCDIK